MAEQITMPLPVREALGRDDFFVSPSNAVALGLVETWPNWSGGKLLLCGPEGAGKTHLAHVWAATSGARIVAADTLSGADIPALATGPVAVEDVNAIAADPDAQNALFHLHNLVLANGHSLLLTGTGDPKYWGLTLPDLASRMMGTTVAALEYPDDTLLKAVMMKLFADRQIMPPPDMLDYLLKHMDRTFSAAQDMVARLDDLSLAEKRPVNRALARRVITGS
ncbi:chromosomal replication initiator DnaA [Shimia biformata]|uniref:chromosomal replication initiator DnaA n=1 Tax=Shimia biformata TaxID=1294299 RepID=UPI0019523304|nr:chromosomal replication initiator DnaA [Shimia biformata]